MFALRQRKTVLNKPGARLLIRWLMTGERKKDKNEKQANSGPFSGPRYSHARFSVLADVSNVR